MKLNILTFTGYYLPAYKAGGPVKTISNMVDNLPDFNFSIVTRDRDLGSIRSFQDVKSDEWQKRGCARVIYLSSKNLSFFKFVQVMNESNFDILYLNSFFDFHFSIKILLAIKLGFVKKSCSIILAPRGEFSKGALAIKSLKKTIYIKVSSLLHLYRGVIWQASSEYERNDIIDTLQVPFDSIVLAKDLPAKFIDSEASDKYKPSTYLRLVFLSRISPMKNLDFAIRVLSSVRCQVLFDIYGPKEDEDYWENCLKLIELLPANISVNYCGATEPERVSGVFSAYDLFFFPTRGENYGHVIAESLSVGTPVLTSDQTPWRNLASDSLGWDLPLELVEVFVDKIEFLAKMSPGERFSYRKTVQVNGLRRVVCDDDIQDNKRLFEFAFQKFKENKV
jgi:glycosyltransferase involved in cell wall biosynthesis